MDDDRLLRYSRQILLPEIGIDGQRKLAAARVLLIGLGGLGSPAALYLAAAGVGTLVIVDDDRVELDNLQRQILHAEDRIGMNKVASAAHTLRALDPQIALVCHDRRLAGQALDDAVGSATLVLDCSDNFATRFMLNQSCRRIGRPLVSAAALRWEGQLAVFDGQPGSPCYRCLYDEQGDDGTNCTDNGVIAPLVGVMGAMQALEAIKLVCGTGGVAANRLLRFDALGSQWRSSRIERDPHCPVCGDG